MNCYTQKETRGLFGDKEEEVLATLLTSISRFRGQFTLRLQELLLFD